MPFFHLLHTPELIRIVRTASSTTARMLSVLVLCLSLAPLGSMYMLYLSFGYPDINGGFQQANSIGDGLASGSAQNSLAQVFSDPNATLEELWVALFIEKQHPTSFNSHMLHQYLSFQGKSVHHWSLVIPWLFSFILGVVVPTVLSIYSLFRQQRQLRREPVDRERRLARILKKIKHFTKVLESDDIQQAATAATDNVATWKLPLSGSQVSVLSEQVNAPNLAGLTGKTRCIPGTCAICLNPYAVGESVTWSPNSDCIHCFHEGCITSWLLSKNSKQRQCPCCRQPFVLSTKAISKATATTTRTTATMIVDQ